MKKLSSVMMGVLFILLGITYLLKEFGLLVNINLWNCMLFIALLSWVVSSLVTGSRAGRIFSISYFYCYTAVFVGLPTVSVWSASVFAALIYFGTCMIFKPARRKKTANNTQNSQHITVSKNFGSREQYVYSKDFSSCNIDSNFGEVTMYFDTAEMQGDTAQINISNCFGMVRLYLPRNWKVEAVNTGVFAFMDLPDPISTPENVVVFDKVLKINATSVLANIEVRYS